MKIFRELMHIKRQIENTKHFDYAQLCKITNVQLLIKPHACKSCTVSYKSLQDTLPQLYPRLERPAPDYIIVSEHFHCHVIHLLYQIFISYLTLKMS